MSISKKIKASMSQSSLIRKMFEEGNLLKSRHGHERSMISVWAIPTWTIRANSRRS